MTYDLFCATSNHCSIFAILTYFRLYTSPHPRGVAFIILWIFTVACWLGWVSWSTTVSFGLIAVKMPLVRCWMMAKYSWKARFQYVFLLEHEYSFIGANSLGIHTQTRRRSSQISNSLLIATLHLNWVVFNSLNL